MKVVITGGAGFIGVKLAREILARNSLAGPGGEPAAVDEIVLFDVAEPDRFPDGLDDRARIVSGDIAERDQVFDLIDRPDCAVFHLASVVSGGGELDFDLALRINLEGGLNVLEACRRLDGRPRLVFASSMAVFGGDVMPKTVGDTTKQAPQTTYGATKAVLELLINDYTRKGFLDGRAARLPTVIVRPGAPNAALSGFASGIFREPLAGVDFVCPVGLDTVMPVIGARTVVSSFMRLHDMAGESLGADRAVQLPCLSASVRDMIACLNRVAGDRTLGRVTVEADPVAQAVCDGWPHRTDDSRAEALDLPRDQSLDAIVGEYIEDEL